MELSKTALKTMLKLTVRATRLAATDADPALIASRVIDMYHAARAHTTLTRSIILMQKQTPADRDSRRAARRLRTHQYDKIVVLAAALRFNSVEAGAIRDDKSITITIGTGDNATKYRL